jgi:phosphoribosyl-ATP pyrophosphohydrolase
VFAALWDAALREASGRDLGGAASLRAVTRETGEDALECIGAAIRQDGAALVQHSASLLSALTLLWAAAGIEPDEIWMELHKRERLGSLLHEMATGEGRARQRRGRGVAHPWRVDSTKLP